MTRDEREGAIIANHLMDFMVQGELFSDEAVAHALKYLLNEAGMEPLQLNFVRSAEAFLGQIWR